MKKAGLKSSDCEATEEEGELLSRRSRVKGKGNDASQGSVSVPPDRGEHEAKGGESRSKHRNDPSPKKAKEATEKQPKKDDEGPESAPETHRETEKAGTASATLS